MRYSPLFCAYISTKNGLDNSALGKYVVCQIGFGDLFDKDLEGFIAFIRRTYGYIEA